MTNKNLFYFYEKNLLKMSFYCDITKKYYKINKRPTKLDC